MPWHYFNENREKIGPFTSRELKQLVQEGTITLIDWMVYTTRAARLYIEEKEDERWRKEPEV